MDCSPSTFVWYNLEGKSADSSSVINSSEKGGPPRPALPLETNAGKLSGDSMPRRRGKKAAQRGKSVRRPPPDTQARRGEKTPDPEFELWAKKARNAIPGDSILIEDPFLEKKIFETQGMNGYAMYLVKDRPEGVAFPGGLGQRLSEVYRRCYEIRKDLTVIRDFVAFLPGLAFNSLWLATLVKDQTTFEDPKPDSPRNRLLTALAYGFRSAAHPGPRNRKWFRANKLLAAREVQRKMQKKFSDHLKPDSLEWKDADEDEKEKRVSELLNKLVKTYPVLKPVSEKLKTHLKASQLRKGSVLATCKIFRVLAHNLESKPSL